MTGVIVAAVVGSCGLAIAGARFAPVLLPVLETGRGTDLLPDRRPERRTVLLGVVAAVVSLLLGLVANSPAELLAWCWLPTVGAVCSSVDWDTHRLPLRLLYPSYPLVLGLLVVAARPDEWARLGSALLGGLLAAALYLVLLVRSPQDMGFGDVVLAGLLGLLGGWHGALIGLLAAVAGSLLALSALLFSRRRHGAAAPGHLPFGPFMVVGATLTLLLVA